MTGYSQLDFGITERFPESADRQEANKLGEELQRLGFVIPGELATTRMRADTYSQGPLGLSVFLTSQEGEDAYQRNVYYMADNHRYNLRIETSLRNGRGHGVEIRYKDDGVLDNVRMFQNGKKVCDMTSELRVLQFFDGCKNILGIHRRDTEAMNNDQMNVLKKRHATLSWPCAAKPVAP